jgi:hypothetical protein
MVLHSSIFTNPMPRTPLKPLVAVLYDTPNKDNRDEDAEKDLKLSKPLLSNQENHDQTPNGSKIYSFKRSHNKLKRILEDRTPLATRSQRRIAAKRNLQSVTQVQNSTDEEEDQSESEEERDYGTTGHQGFFETLQCSKSSTSNNTLKFNTMDQSEYLELLQSAPKKHANELEYLKSVYRSCFKQYLFELESGFNLMFYGYGSKRNLLLEFADKHLNGGI